MDTGMLQDFQDYNGSVAGNFDKGQLEELYKAMSAGDITGAQTWNSTTASGAPLKVESLENTLKVLTAKPRHAPFFSKIAKRPATNTIEEYVQLVSYGDFDGGFTIEGELPEASDSIYRRKAQHVKYMGLVGGVTLPMQLVNTGAGVNDMMAQEAKNKALALMNMMEHALPYADSRIVPENFNGLYAQHETEGPKSTTLQTYMDSDLVIDCKGKVLSDEVVELGSQTIVNNFGLATTLISHPAVFSNYNKRYYDKKFIRPVPEDVRNGVFGQRVNEIWTQNGGIEILQSNFFRHGLTEKTTATLPTSTKAPAAPTISVATVTDAQSKFPTGTTVVYYAVAARNRYGESALAPAAASTSVTNGEAVDITITPGAGYYAASGFAIYRSEPLTSTSIPVTAVKFFKVFEVGADDLNKGYDGSAGSTNTI
jgi:hypothetical protein